MGLASFTVATETVALPDGDTLAVRGLSFEDIAVLVRSHYTTARALFDRFVREAAMDAVDQKVSGGLLGLADMQDTFLEVVGSAPGLFADMIARGCGEPHLANQARLLPMAVQIEAVEKIVTLTLQAEGGMEKLVETVARLAGSMASLRADRSQ